MRKLRRHTRNVRSEQSLNLIALAAVFAGFVFPLLQMTPERFVNNAGSLAASTGVSLSAAVSPNPHSLIAEQLSEKERALAEREIAMSAAERPRGFTLGEIMGFASFALSLVLCALMGLNFYLDCRRRRKPGMLGSKFSVDLR